MQGSLLINSQLTWRAITRAHHKKVGFLQDGWKGTEEVRDLC